MDALARLGRKIGSEKQIDTDTLNDYLEEAKEIAAILYEKDETD